MHFWWKCPCDKNQAFNVVCQCGVCVAFTRHWLLWTAGSFWCAESPVLHLPFSSWLTSGWIEGRLTNTNHKNQSQTVSLLGNEFLNMRMISYLLLVPNLKCEQGKPGLVSSIWMASSAGFWLVSPSVSRWQTGGTWPHFVSMAVAWLVTGTDLETSLLKTSRTCLELIAMGNSRGDSKGKILWIKLLLKVAKKFIRKVGGTRTALLWY